ncbi:MAG: hypothetical protein ACFE9Z_03295 [Promethearchaeota archaeon]
MVNLEKIKQNVQKEIYNLRNLGEHGRKGSDHLYHRSLSNIEFKKLKKVRHNKKIAFEVVCKYDIYNETEFLHSSEMEDLYTEHYNDQFLLDEDYVILKVIDKSEN